MYRLTDETGQIWVACAEHAAENEWEGDGEVVIIGPAWNGEGCRSCHDECNVIELRIEGREWVATYIGPHAQRVTELFGAATIPTAYLSMAAPSFVRLEIARRNPGVDVIVR